MIRDIVKIEVFESRVEIKPMEALDENSDQFLIETPYGKRWVSKSEGYVENNPIAVQDYLYFHRREIKKDMYCLDSYIDTIDKALADIYSGRYESMKR